MKIKALTLAILTSSIIPTASAVEVTGFSAGEYSVQGNIGKLQLKSPSQQFLNLTGITTASVDISKAENTEEMVTIILTAAPGSVPADMLANYPSTPTTAEGIAAYEAITGNIINNDAEFKTTIDAYLQNNKYSGVTVNFQSGQSLLTQTANNTVIVNYDETQGESIYICDTDTVSLSEPVTNQPACSLIDSDAQTIPFEYKTTPNGSFYNDNFVYTTDVSMFGDKTYKAYVNGDIISIPGMGGKTLSPTLEGPPSIFAPSDTNSVYEHTAGATGFNFYNISGESYTPVNIYDTYGSEPESVLYHTAGKADFYDKTGEDGQRYLIHALKSFRLTNGFSIEHFYNENYLPIKLQAENGMGYGFSDNITILQETSWHENIAAGYYGSRDLAVYTPAIYNTENELFTYLSPVAIKHLETTTPEGFISAVRTAVLKAIPATLANAYPELPADLSGFNIDPEITPQAFRALVDERVMRTATSGALEQFLSGAQITVGTLNQEEEQFRWSSNEFKFTSTNKLRAPYASYEINNVVAPIMTVTVDNTELLTGSDETAMFTVTAEGNYRIVRVSCSALNNNNVALQFQPAEAGSWGQNSIITSNSNTSTTGTFVNYLAPEETAANGTVMTVSVKAISGLGEVPVNCSVRGDNGLGNIKTTSISTIINVISVATINGSFTSSDQAILPTAISASLIAEDGTRTALNINEDLTFSQPVGAEGTYNITAAAEGYVFPCAETSVPVGTTDIGALAFLRGDVNGDGEISSADLWRFYFRAFYPSTDFDVNNDDAVNNADRDMIRANQGAVQCDL